jgi:hypothetical protein
MGAPTWDEVVDASCRKISTNVAQADVRGASSPNGRNQRAGHADVDSFIIFISARPMSW